MLATALLVLASRPGDAGHGAPYALLGTARDRRFGGVYISLLNWQRPSNFALTLFSAPGGGALETFFIPGHESFETTFFAPRDWCPLAEVSHGYRGVDDATNGEVLDVRGRMYEVAFGGPRDGDRRLDLQGHFFGLFDLRFAGSGWALPRANE